MSCAVGRVLLVFFPVTATTQIYTLSLHDALPICAEDIRREGFVVLRDTGCLKDVSGRVAHHASVLGCQAVQDRKSTRLNSSHANISYAVFCLKKKTSTSVRRPEASRIACSSEGPA